MPHLLVVGGSDAGIAAALAARGHDPRWEVSVALADRYPNFSICEAMRAAPGASHDAPAAVVTRESRRCLAPRR